MAFPTKGCNTEQRDRETARNGDPPRAARQPDALPVHPYGELVPRMDRAAFDGFLADVGRRGVLVPLDLTRAGIVLDGRERLRAARALGMESVASAEDHAQRAVSLRRITDPSPSGP